MSFQTAIKETNTALLNFTQWGDQYISDKHEFPVAFMDQKDLIENYIKEINKLWNFQLQIEEGEEALSISQIVESLEYTEQFGDAADENYQAILSGYNKTTEEHEVAHKLLNYNKWSARTITVLTLATAALLVGAALSASVLILAGKVSMVFGVVIGFVNLAVHWNVEFNKEYFTPMLTALQTIQPNGVDLQTLSTHLRNKTASEEDLNAILAEIKGERFAKTEKPGGLVVLNPSYGGHNSRFYAITRLPENLKEMQQSFGTIDGRQEKMINWIGNQYLRELLIQLKDANRTEELDWLKTELTSISRGKLISQAEKGKQRHCFFQPPVEEEDDDPVAVGTASTKTEGDKSLHSLTGALGLPEVEERKEE